YSDDLSHREAFEIIVWTSGKLEFLDADRIRPRTQVISTLSEIYSTIAHVLGRNDILQAPPEKRDEIVHTVLSQRRTLLIVDNLETIDDDLVTSFLLELPAPTKAIVTTRHDIPASFPVELSNLPQTDASKLIRDHCSHRNIVLPKDKEKTLCQRTDGIPLAIIWSVSQIARGYEVDTVLERLKDSEEDLSQFCFKKIVDDLKASQFDAYSMLLALSLFADFANRKTLGYMIGLDNNCLEDVVRRDNNLADLVKYSLVNKIDNKFRMLSLTRSYARAQLSKEPNLEITLRRRWLNYFNNLLLLTDHLNFELLDLEHGNIADVIEWCWRNGHISDFLEFVDRFSSFLWARGYWAENEELLSKALEYTDDLKQLEKPKAKLNVHLAYILSVNKKYKEAEEACQRSLAILKTFDDTDAYVGALSVLGYIYIQKDSLEDAEEVLREGLKLAHVDTLQDKGLRARILRNLGQIYSEKKIYNKAMKFLDEALGVFEKYEIKNDQYSYTYRLAGITAMKQGKTVMARNFLEKSLDLATEFKVPIDINRAMHELAHLEASVGNKNRALNLAEQAKKGHMELGDIAGIVEMQTLIDKLEVEAR
ncbi:MAG: hypothetical protein KDJ52_32165, partial [Anaerolineae bacterium]|nr:hypothetical protein [Anaerolineae bacterium]